MAEKTETSNGNGNHRFKIVGIATAAGLILFGIYYVLIGRNRISTDDAFIEAHVIPISSQVSGPVQKVLVLENQLVKKGDLLVLIDPTDYTIKLGQAQAERDAAKAEARKADLDAQRFQELFAKEQVSRQVRDHAVTAADIAKANAVLADRKVDQAQRDLDNTKIFAPEDGRTARKNVEPGSIIQTGQPLIAIVPSEVWVTANFKETQVTRMEAGQKVEIKVDAFPSRTFHGHIDTLQPGTGARFSLFPPENATGNFVKVVQRIPVKIRFDDPPEALKDLAPGMSAEPVVHLR